MLKPTPALADAVEALRTAFDREQRLRRTQFDAARALHVAGHFSEAEHAYRELIARAPEHADGWAGLGCVCIQNGRHAEAFQALTTSLRLERHSALAHFGFGDLLAAGGEGVDFLNAYADLVGVTIDGEAPGRSASGLDEMIAMARASVVARPGRGACLTLGDLLMARHDLVGAADNYEQALRYASSSRRALRNLSVACALGGNPGRAAMWLGLALSHEGEPEAAIEAFRDAAADPHVTLTADASIALGDCWRSLDRHEEALRAYQDGLDRWPDSADLYLQTASALHRLGRTIAAVRVARRGVRRFPASLELRYQRNLMLPVVYETERQIDRWREHYARGLTDLRARTSLETPEDRHHALDVISTRTNFYLPYQGRNDRNLQARYGEWVARITAANHPQLAVPRSPAPPSAAQKIRVGYVSAYCHHHSVANSHLGWLRHHDRQRVEVYCYHLGLLTDLVTEEFRRHSDTFRHCPGALESAMQQIAADDVHILVYLDLGMFPGATAIAGLRLAPVQCLAAAHPETSGLPTIDYFLSAVLMEPPDGAQSYYTESLVLLPNTGMAYSKPGGALPGRTRAMVGLREDATVYLCCQSIFKYLPQHDGLLVDIARRVPGSQFVFVAGHPAGGLLERRVRWAFESAGVGGEDTLCFLPRQRESEFLELMSLSDVYLDSVDWNGMNTTHQAVAAGLPIVTWPRGAMRGRHSFAILTMLGVTETIAGSGSEYVSIAVRLGLDRDFRRDVSSRLLAGQSKLFDDVECVRALEGWYEEVARGGAGGEGR